MRADPAGNITVFVMNPPDDAECRIAAVRAIMADSGLKAEQLGFVLPPKSPGGLWSLEMMGGEFCGNASRSFGLLVAGLTGICGPASLKVKVSGAKQPLEVQVDTLSAYAEIQVPSPLAETSIEYKGKIFPLTVFEGISHIIAEDTAADLGLAHELLQKAEQAADTGLLCTGHPDACGIMFYYTGKQFMQPLVWVRATGTFVSESSCGSGSAALAVRLARDAVDIDQVFAIAQPGGTISAHVVKRVGLLQRLSIGGKVRLGEPVIFKII